MKHHFGDSLDRKGNYWTVVPNAQRYAYRLGNVRAGSKKIKIATIGAEDNSWKDVFTFPNLEELTLHSPSSEQLQAISTLSNLKRLRITHARPKDISFISSLTRVEELVLEYVSGFSDLSPLRSLSRLKSLHIENLRRVNDFGGLSGIASLRYLQIEGTLDWKQPIHNFEFLRGLPRLEFLGFFQIISKVRFPGMLPALTLKNLKRLKLTWNELSANEYALLEVGLKNVEGADWGPLRRFDGWFEFTGKRAGRTKCSHVDAEKKCSAYALKYEKMKADAERIIAASKQES